MAQHVHLQGLASKDGAKVQGWEKLRYGFVLFLDCYSTDKGLLRYCFRSHELGKNKSWKGLLCPKLGRSSNKKATAICLPWLNIKLYLCQYSLEKWEDRLIYTPLEVLLFDVFFFLIFGTKK